MPFTYKHYAFGMTAADLREMYPAQAEQILGGSGMWLMNTSIESEDDPLIKLNLTSYACVNTDSAVLKVKRPVHFCPIEIPVGELHRLVRADKSAHARWT